MYKYLLICSLALMLAVSGNPVTAKENHPTRSSSTLHKKIIHKKAKPVHPSKESSIMKKYEEINNLKSEIGRVDLKIQKKYEEIDQLQGYNNRSNWSEISYP